MTFGLAGMLLVYFGQTPAGFAAVVRGLAPLALNVYVGFERD